MSYRADSTGTSTDSRQVIGELLGLRRALLGRLTQLARIRELYQTLKNQRADALLRAVLLRCERCLTGIPTPDGLQGDDGVPVPTAFLSLLDHAVRRDTADGEIEDAVEQYFSGIEACYPVAKAK
ncbi:MAG: hypothetical protein IJC43_04065 [Clostridia bacterium]|nr:hypothetical protein [Clostridia bacterium]